MPAPFDYDAEALDFLLSDAVENVADVTRGATDGVLSVGGLNRRIGQVLEEEPLLREVAVRGEISGWKCHSSGHCYFSLKDEGGDKPASIRCCLWRTSAGRLGFRPGNGDRVVASGSVDFYAARGEVSFIVSDLRFDGTGALFEAMERTKAKLEAEGLFDPARKRPLPVLPRRIGIVTSSQGAVMHDIITVLTRRWPLATLVLVPTKVQGFDAVGDLLRALTWAAAYEELDVVIVARGGGSPEDLAAFNDEELARAAADFPVPLISAIGHETDVCLLDWVADVRAPTPSVAAEIVAPDAQQVLALLNGLRLRMHRSASAPIAAARARLEWNKTRPGLRHPRETLREGRRGLESVRARLQAALERRVRIERHTLAARSAQLHALDPQRVLERGYALIERPDGSLLTQAAQSVAGEKLSLRLHDGRVAARVEERVEEDEGGQ
jgi:exodeoxyribonuclease VII large subunit